MAKRRLISKRVKVLDCNCDTERMQIGAHRFDFCKCRVRVEVGRRKALEPLPEVYGIGTVFIGVHPEKAWRK